jgi:hypothetical protein
MNQEKYNVFLIRKLAQKLDSDKKDEIKLFELLNKRIELLEKSLKK